MLHHRYERDAVGFTPVRRTPTACRLGISLVESLVALSIAALAGSALLLAMETTLRTTDDAVEATIAEGIAQQMMDEILGYPYKEKGGSPYVIWPTREVGEGSWQDPQRDACDDTDDLQLYRAQPAPDMWGIPLGQGDGRGGTRHPAFQAPSGYFDDWMVWVTVAYVDENDHSQNLPPWRVSDYRAAEITVYRYDKINDQWRQLTQLRRVFAYVPPYL